MKFLKHIFFYLYIVFISQPLLANKVLFLEDNFFPEGIAISKYTGDIYVGSLKESKIVKFPNGKNDAEEFIPSAAHGLLSVIGIIVDDKHKILWACSSNPGVTNYPSDNPVSLKAFDLDNGEPIQSYEFPNGGFCNDITLDSNDNVYVTDSFNPRILRLNKSKSRLETWFENEAFEGKGFNLNGITFVDNNIYTVKYNSGELFKIGVGDNGKPMGFTKIDLPRLLNSPDGIKAINKKNLLVVENKGSLTHINFNKTVTLKILRDNLDTPTTVAIKGKTAWVLQAQFGHLYGDEKDIPPGPFEIIGVKLKPSILTSLKKLLNFMN